jgi:dTDP-4-dehydrorhamnose 3,5-epimerase-like enzyme
VNTSCDDRRLAFFNVFDVTPGQVNIVHLRKGAICAWHRHTEQTDHYFCVSGAVKVGKITGDVLEWFVLDALNPATITIPPGSWHGYTALTDGAVLLQYLDRKFNAGDEERKTVAEMAVDWSVRSR